MLIDYKKVNVYQEDKLILKDVNIQADKGDFIYLIGKVGSGKSSLLKTMYCELDVDKDDVDKAEVLGQSVVDIKRKDVPALRRQMGIIFQDFQLLHDRTVYRNLRFVLRATGWTDREAIDARIDQVLDEVGMADKRDKMPHELSGGEQQRIAIARAILNKPKIIIADEPTGNLDPDTATRIVELLRNQCETGAAVIMSTHNIHLLSKFPGIVYRCQKGTFTNVTDEYFSTRPAGTNPVADTNAEAIDFVDEDSSNDTDVDDNADIAVGEIVEEEK